jgi:hypothetical protein
MDTEPRQQPVPNQGTDNTDDEVADHAKPGPTHDLTRQPAGDHADQQDHKKTFTRHVDALRGGLDWCRAVPDLL